MALVDCSNQRQYLASVLARQEWRRRRVNASGYAPQPALGVALDGNAQAGPSSPRWDARPPSKRNVTNYIAAEEAVRNDYAAWYGVSGSWPSNYVLGASSPEICEE